MFRRGFAVTSKSLGTYSLTVFVPSKVPLLLLFAIMANPVSCSSMSGRYRSSLSTNLLLCTFSAQALYFDG